MHPDYRGRGYVRSMLDCVHAWLSHESVPFSVLFGNPKIYGSSGYVLAENLRINEDGKGWKPVRAMMRPMSDIGWPDGDVQMVGPKF